jgi:hypothetical protein
MKTGRTLQDLAVELDRQAAMKRDFVISTADMDFYETAEKVALYDNRQQHIDGSVSLGMTGLFHRQLGASVGIPAKYYDRLRDASTELLAQNVNYWLQNEPSKHMIRTMDGAARAFLSDRYRRLDNYEIAQATLPVIGEMPKAQVMSCEVTDTKMYIKVVNPRLEAEVKPGDIVQAGIIISNSEVGLGSVSVVPLVYRLVCSNGMVVNDLGQRKYHVGREVAESWELFSDETLQADDAAFMLKLADIVRAAVDEARFGTVVDKLREASDVKLGGDIPHIVELTSRQYGISKPEENDILRHLIEGGDLSLYGLSSAVTRTSQDVEDYDRATELESVGWQIVTMEPRLWRELNEGVRV